MLLDVYKRQRFGGSLSRTHPGRIYIAATADTEADMDFLYALEGIRTPALDAAMSAITQLGGEVVYLSLIHI